MILQRDVAALRSLLTDIYPADLEAGGLVPELEVLAARTREHGVEVAVHVDSEVADISLDVSRLTYRVVREGLRNVVTHADAAHARVRVVARDDDVVVEVEDDGRGVSATRPGDERESEGHLGLRLLAQTLTRLGGTLDLGPSAAGGALLRATFPVALSARPER